MFIRHTVIVAGHDDRDDISSPIRAGKLVVRQKTGSVGFRRDVRQIRLRHTDACGRSFRERHPAPCQFASRPDHTALFRQMIVH
jgi:hypothetical protein